MKRCPSFGPLIMILFLLVSVIAIATAQRTKALPAAVAAFVRGSVEPRTRLLGHTDPLGSAHIAQ